MALDPTKPYYLVLTTDPNLDKGKMKVSEYMDTRDPQLIIDKPGCKAVRFHMHPLSNLVIDTLDVRWKNEQVKHKMAFQVSIRAVETATETVDVDLDSTQFGDEKVSAANQDFLDSFRYHFGKETMEILGSIAYDLASKARVASPFTSALSLRGGKSRKSST